MTSIKGNPGACRRSAFAPFVAGVVSIALALAFVLAPAAQAGPIDDAQLVADLALGPGDSSPEQLTRVGDQIFFAANGPDGEELFVSDGTTAGTHQVADINPGTADSDPASLTAFQGKLYFSADDGTDTELWISDGTAAGTFKRDLNPAGSSTPSELTDVNGILFFMADGDGTGRELWTSDGTTGGTAMVVDRNVGSGNSGGSEFADINGKLFFRGSNNNNTDFEPWISDGTAAGTYEIADLLSGGSGAGSLPGDFVEMGGIAYFAADGHSIMGTTESDRELYRSDGTAAGTYRVKDIATGGSPSGSDSAGPGELTVIGNTLYFSAGDRAALTGGNRELWKSDGTEAGTEVVKEIVAGNPGSNPSELTKVGSKLFFGTSTGANGEVWVSDGTDLGTEAIADGLLLDGFAFNGELVAGMYDGNDAELWRSDGTAAGTVLVKDINDDNGNISNRYPKDFAALDGSVFFSAGNSANGIELFKALDTVEPATAIDSGPTGGAAGTDRSPEHTFGSDDPPSTFECRTTEHGDTPASFAPCSGPGDSHSSPFPLIDGDYTFEVRAIDLSGNADSTPASAEFTVDNVGPETTIDSAPASRTADQQPQVTFFSVDADATSFECSLDGAVFDACTNPVVPPAALADGPHSFKVRAVDGAGNRGQAELVSFTVDATGPAIQIDSAPDATTPDSTPVLRFSSPEVDAVAFQCAIDGGEFSGCGSPYTVPELADGPHTVAVRARDDLGNVGVSREVSFTVDTTVPDTKVDRPLVTLPKKITVKGADFKVKVKAGAAEKVQAIADGTMVFKRKKRKGSKARTLKLASVTRTAKVGKRTILKIRFKGKKSKRKRLTRKLKGTLRKGKKSVRLRVRVTLTDEAGNAITRKRGARLKLKR